MKEKLKVLKTKRTDLEDSKAELALRRKAFEEENADLIGSIQKLSGEIGDVETGIRQNALELFKMHNDKDVGFGVKVKECVVLEYDDRKAFEWAVEHNLCLKLDASAFKSICKTQVMAFVKKSVETRATIPKVIEVD